MKCTLIQTLLALRLCAARDWHLPCRSLEAGSEKNTTNHDRRWQRLFFSFRPGWSLKKWLMPGAEGRTFERAVEDEISLMKLAERRADGVLGPQRTHGTGSSLPSPKQNKNKNPKSRGLFTIRDLFAPEMFLILEPFTLPPPLLPEAKPSSPLPWATGRISQLLRLPLPFSPKASTW